MGVSFNQKAILRTLSVLEPSSVSCGKVRVGGSHDGGYVMANDFYGNHVGYSIGVGPQVFWDQEMANRGLEIFQYDHTVDAVPGEHSLFRYFKKGIGPDLNDPNLMTLERMLEDNGHIEQEHMLLKMDVEGAEWDALDAMRSDIIAKFDQIVVEYHALDLLHDLQFRNRAERVFRKLSETHRCIHVHGNNFGGYRIIENIPIAPVIEVTYGLIGRFNFDSHREEYPTHLDEPCNPAEPDLYLGNFRFRY